MKAKTSSCDLAGADAYCVYLFYRVSYYVLEDAYKLCKEKRLIPCMVFILGRMGNTNEALTLIVNELQDVKQVRLEKGWWNVRRCACP